jgi:hypothetical protein
MTVGLPARRRCRQCGNEFRPIRRYDQVFCRPECRRAWHSWRESRGARAVELLIAWRGARRRGSLTKLAAFADELLHDHREHEVERVGRTRGAPGMPVNDLGRHRPCRMRSAHRRAC